MSLIASFFSVAGPRPKLPPVAANHQNVTRRSGDEKSLNAAQSQRPHPSALGFSGSPISSGMETALKRKDTIGPVKLNIPLLRSNICGQIGTGLGSLIVNDLRLRSGDARFVNVQTVHRRRLAAVRREVAPGAVGSAWRPALDKVRVHSQPARPVD